MKYLQFSEQLASYFTPKLIETPQAINKESFLTLFKEAFSEVFSDGSSKVMSDEALKAIKKEGFLKIYVDHILPALIEDRNNFINLYSQLFSLDITDKAVVGNILTELNSGEVVKVYFKSIYDRLAETEKPGVDKILASRDTASLEDFAIISGFYTPEEYTHYLLSYSCDIDPEQIEELKKVVSDAFESKGASLSEKPLSAMSKEEVEKLTEEEINSKLDKEGKGYSC